MGIMKEISVKALAKINLGLDVVRRREDGYHEVKMVMQTIHLFDRLEMKKTAMGNTEYRRDHNDNEPVFFADQ